MALQYVSDVGSLFRAYCDEPDGSFMTDDQVAVFLELGYEEFRRFITRLQPGTFSRRVTITLSSSAYDLADTANAVVLFGPDANLTETDAAGNKLRLLSIARAMRSASPNVLLQPAASLEMLEDGHDISGFVSDASSTSWASKYFLDGTVLRFSSGVSGSIVLDYIPQQTVDWTQLGSAATEWIDDFLPYHDIIALLAYRHYAIKDMESNQQLDAALQVRMADLEQFIIHRNHFQSSYVV